MRRFSSATSTTASGSRPTSSLATPGSKVIELNGATAHLGKIGDRLTIMSFAQVPAEVAHKHKPTIVRLDEKNDVLM